MQSVRSTLIASFALLCAIVTTTNVGAQTFTYSGPNSASVSRDVSLANDNTVRSIAADITAGHSNALLVVTSSLSTAFSVTGPYDFFCDVYANENQLYSFIEQSSREEGFGAWSPLSMSKTLAVDLASYGLANVPVNVRLSCSLFGYSQFFASLPTNLSLVAYTVPR